MNLNIISGRLFAGRFFTGMVAGVVLGLSACSTISEDSCRAGNWEAVGFKHGVNGYSQDRLSKISRECYEYGVSIDNKTYWAGYEAGLGKYCTFQRGYEQGESGYSYNQVCSGELAVDYAPGYDAGRVVHDIYDEHDRLVQRYEKRREDLRFIRARLRHDVELSEKERSRLRSKAKRLKRAIRNLRYDVRAFEHEHDLPRYDFV